MDAQLRPVHADGRIDVMIVAEVRLYREGLAQALQHADSLRVIATAARPSQLRTTLATQPHAVVLLDVAGVDGHGAALALLKASPLPRIVALGIGDREADVIACSEAGVAGYVTRDESIAQLVATIHSVARDELQCSPRVAAALNRRVAALAAERRVTALEGRLSRREMEVISLIDQGLSNREIAHRLCIELATAKNHVHNILEKLGVRRRADAAAWARGQRNRALFSGYCPRGRTSVRDSAKETVNVLPIHVSQVRLPSLHRPCPWSLV
jgi:DNA-binding NarL/FixJ family response regulator